MNKTLRARVHLKVAEQQLPLHKNLKSESRNRQDNSRNLLGKHWQDKTVSAGLKDACYKALVTNSNAPSFSSSGVFERTTSTGCVNVYIRM